MEKQKRLIQQEIAKLSGKPADWLSVGVSADEPGAISRHAGPSRPSSYDTNSRAHPYAPRGAPRGRGMSRGRGLGRGGGSYGLDLRATNKATPPTASTGAPIPASTPVTSSQSEKEKEDGEVSPGPSSPSKGKGKEEKPQAVEENWVKQTSKGGNMSLMTVQKR